MGTKSTRSSGTQFNPKGVTQGNTLIDPNTGDPVSVITDVSGKRRLCVDANITAQTIQVNVDLDGTDGDTIAIVDPDSGNSLEINADGSINANTEVDAADGDSIAIPSFEEIFSYTSSNNNTRIIAVECTVSTPSIIRLKIDGVIKKELRTSSLERNIIFEFREHRPIDSGKALTVEAKVERFILSSYATFTSLEG